MKIAPNFPRAFLIAALTVLGLGTAKADNFFDNTIMGVNLANGSGGANVGGNGHRNWAIFAMSGGVTITDPILDGNFDVFGNVAIAGSGILTMSASRIQGNIQQVSTSMGNITGGANYAGYTYTQGGANAPYVTQGSTDITTASTTAGNLGNMTGGLTFGGLGAGVPTTIALNNAPATISGAAGQTYVLNLQDLILAGAGAVLTLSGTSTTNYVINVNRYMTLSSNAQIALGGTLASNNVLFNVKNTNPSYDVTLSGGAVVNGIVMAATRNVKLTSGATVYGEVIAKGVSLSGRSKVINPFISP